MPSKEVVVFSFADKITVENADGLKQRLEMILADKQAVTVIFDLARVRLCDSCGLRLLIHCQRDTAAKGKKLMLYRPDVLFTELLENTKLSHVFTIVDKLDPSLEQAIQ
jgi:anti-anti-sigma factor